MCHYPLMPYSDAYIAWFNTQVEKGPGCWPWVGPVSKWGYGRAWVGKNKRRAANRVALEIALGRELPRTVFACHKCNNPICCRVGPEHVYAGTPKQNTADRVAAGNIESHFTREKVLGVKNPAAKITENDVRDLRVAWLNGATGKELCKKYNLSKGQISSIITRRTWTHVE